MRIVKNPADRKQEILDAAIRVFANKGYEKTSITDIAKEINVSQGLCYRYFPSKESMYDAAVEEYASYIVEKSINKTEKPGFTLKEQIEHMSEKISEYACAEHEKSDLYGLFHKEGNQRLHNDLFLAVGDKLVPHVAELLETAKSKGETDISDCNAAAYFFVFGQIGILMSSRYSNNEKSQKIKNCLLEFIK